MHTSILLPYGCWRHLAPKALARHDTTKLRCERHVSAEANTPRPKESVQAALTELEAFRFKTCESSRHERLRTPKIKLQGRMIEDHGPPSGPSHRRRPASRLRPWRRQNPV